jgi:hypothetical protein
LPCRTTGLGHDRRAGGIGHGAQSSGEIDSCAGGSGEEVGGLDHAGAAQAPADPRQGRVPSAPSEGVDQEQHQAPVRHEQRLLGAGSDGGGTEGRNGENDRTDKEERESQ